MSRADEQRARRLKEAYDRLLPPPKSEEERQQEAEAFLEAFVADAVEHAREYDTNRRRGFADPADASQLTKTQVLGLACSYGGEEPPPRAKAAVLDALREEPGGWVDPDLAERTSALLTEVFRLALEAFNAEPT
ncbi:MAG TPA: hypothetical protein VKA51_02015 [Rubrobacteraceae bacterium]|nr:hypothetical protein [Rubrobacteraceae bacterium]